MDTNLSAADASFWGENPGDQLSYVAGAGDVNHDGYADFLIGSRNNSENGAYAGQVYLVYGKAADWAMDTPISTAAFSSFRGEAAGDVAGCTISGAGDVNKDGFADFLIGSPANNENGDYAGQAYLILGASESPLAVQLTSFTVAPVPGAVLVEWETASEIDTVGFYILRSQTPEGTYTRINSNLIPAMGSTISGYSYAYVDKDIIPGKICYYRLEEIDDKGNSTFYTVTSDRRGIISRAWTDVNGDGKTDMKDVLYLLQIVTRARK
jgi:hypothetical protein